MSSSAKIYFDAVWRQSCKFSFLNFLPSLSRQTFGKLLQMSTKPVLPHDHQADAFTPITMVLNLEFDCLVFQQSENEDLAQSQPLERGEEKTLSLITVNRESYSWPRNWFGEGAAQVMSSIVSSQYGAAQRESKKYSGALGTQLLRNQSFRETAVICFEVNMIWEPLVVLLG